MNEQLTNFYAAHAGSVAADMAVLRRRGRYYLAGQLAFFLLAVGCAVLATVAVGGLWWLAGGALMLAAYVAVRHFDGRNSAQLQQLARLRSVYEKELRYQQGDFSAFDDGQRYADPKHPFTLDLDIFGPQSLYQRMCRAVTTGGADSLARELSDVQTPCDHGPALAELAAAEPWRAAFMAMGQEQPIDTGGILQAVQGASAMRVPAWFARPVALCVAWAVLAGFYASVVLAVVGVVGAQVPTLWGLLQLLIVVGLASRSLRQVAKASARLHRSLAACVGLIRHITQAPFAAGECRDIRRLLDDEALPSFELLGSVVRGIDQRSNEVGGVVLNAFALFDFFLVRRFLRWQAHYMGRMESWVEAVSRMDALVSMATFCHNHPEATRATVVPGREVVFEARGLRHPFLGPGAVGNDFSAAHRHFYIVTGANMAGKSTFLRAIGTNYVLAMRGLPVFAEQLTVSAFRLFTSMRTTDDLAHGISYFNAELLRLKQLMDSVSPTVPTLIILDEILKGTNSLDKLNGSRLFLREMAGQNVTGIIATHDLELSKMADEDARFHNFCFEIELGTAVTYSYRLSPGVARNQNATFLLRQIISKDD